MLNPGVLKPPRETEAVFSFGKSVSKESISQIAKVGFQKLEFCLEPGASQLLMMVHDDGW